MKKIFTLCKGKGCCPELFQDNKNEEAFYLTDDFHGRVRLTKDELVILQEKLNAMFPWRRNE